MKKLIAILSLLACPVMSAEYVVFSDGSTLYTRSGATTSTVSTASDPWASNRIVNVSSCSLEPMGLCYDIAERASMVFTNSTRTFAIYSSTNWTYWHAGTPVVRTNDSIAISTNLGLHFIYYDDTTATIKESTVPWNFSNDVQVAMVYWDGVEGTLSWEAHKMTMDWATHDELHSTFGARWASGLRSTAGINAITNEAGVFYDEDIRFSISATTNTALAFHTNGVLCLRAGYNKPYLTNSTGIIVYDNGTTTNTVAAGEYVASFTFAANVPASPIVTVIGQRVDTTLANAKANNTLGNLLTGSLPLAEMKPLARHIYHRANGTGTLIYDEAEDLRNLSIITSTTAPLPPHDSTIGAASSTIHTNYALLTGATFTGTMIATNAGIVSNALAVGGTAAALILTNNDARSQTLSNTSVSNASGVVASRNLQLGSYWLSGDGGGEGVFVDSSGNVYVGTNGQVVAGGTSQFTISPSGLFGQSLVDVASFTNTGPAIRGFVARGTKTAPTAIQAGDGMLIISARGYDGSAWSGAQATWQCDTAETWTPTAHGANFTFYTTPTQSTTRAEAVRILSDRRIRMANLSNPTDGTASGYGYIGASNSEVYVWDGSGNRTLLSAENEWGEMIRRTEKPMAGFAEEYNQTLAGQMLEELAASSDAKTDAEIKTKYKGRIYRKWAIEVTDWRENEQRQATERAKEISRWDAEATRYTSALVAWQESPNKGKTPQPDQPDQGDRPAVYTPRPVPSWATNAQSKFDAKWKDSPK